MAAQSTSLLVVCLLAFATASGAVVSFASIQPAKLGVNLTFNASGSVFPNPLCTQNTLNAPCLPMLSNTNGDSITISWATLPGFTTNSTATATIKLCYAAPSTVDRAWRKADDNLKKDKQCGSTIGPDNSAFDLPATNGTYTWKIPQSAAIAVYFIRVYIQCTPSPSDQQSQCAYGNSAGFFQLNPIDSTPPSLIHAVIGLAFMGPVCLLGFFLVERFLKKRK